MTKIWLFPIILMVAILIILCIIKIKTLYNDGLQSQAVQEINFRAVSEEQLISYNPIQFLIKYFTQPLTACRIQQGGSFKIISQFLQYIPQKDINQKAVYIYFCVTFLHKNKFLTLIKAYITIKYMKIVSKGQLDKFLVVKQGNIIYVIEQEESTHFIRFSYVKTLLISGTSTLAFIIVWNLPTMIMFNKRSMKTLQSHSHLYMKRFCMMVAIILWQIFLNLILWPLQSFLIHNFIKQIKISPSMEEDGITYLDMTNYIVAAVTINVAILFVYWITGFLKGQ